MVYQNGNFIVGNGLVPFRCVVPFGHVTEGVKPQPYEGWFTRMVNFIVGNGLVPFRCVVPFGHVTEGVKPLPYES